MNYEELIGLIDQLDGSSVAYMDYKTDSGHLVLSKEVPTVQTSQETSQATEATEEKDQTQVVQEMPEKEVVVEEAAPVEKTGKAVESPMVGVVYLQSNPDEPQFVQVGDRVEKGEVVCIIEAMKLMNEIQAPHSGVVTEILVENEDVVEYKQPLILID